MKGRKAAGFTQLLSVGLGLLIGHAIARRRPDSALEVNPQLDARSWRIWRT
jgi:uncharacterized protein YneF (UPF0154 family)